MVESWSPTGCVELVDGDWNDTTALAAALKGVEAAFVMLPAVWAPSPDYREAKGVIANYRIIAEAPCPVLTMAFKPQRHTKASHS